MNIPFIDLKSQYNSLQVEINEKIQTVLNHGQFIMGPEVNELETKLSKFTGSKHCISCSSGTDAAVIAMMAWEIGVGSEVIVPAFSFIATAEAVLLTGATPVMIDVDPSDFNIDVLKIEAAISAKTKAICPVSLYGQPANMDEINQIAQKHGLLVIEDAAQSFGAKYKDRMSCNLSDVGVTSFFPAKPLGCYGDGGAIFTNDDKVAEIMRSIRIHGQAERYHHVRVGLNGRMDTLQCAIMLPKLDHFSWELEQRQVVAKRYEMAFDGNKNIITPQVPKNKTSAWAQYTILVENRKDVQARLEKKGVPTAVHYPIPMSKQQAYLNNSKVISDLISTKLSQRVLSLPMHPYMSEDTQKYICESVIEAVSNY